MPGEREMGRDVPPQRGGVLERERAIVRKPGISQYMYVSPYFDIIFVAAQLSTVDTREINTPKVFIKNKETIITFKLQSFRIRASSLTSAYFS